jgi:hypothetical protein
MFLVVILWIVKIVGLWFLCGAVASYVYARRTIDSYRYSDKNYKKNLLVLDKIERNEDLLSDSECAWWVFAAGPIFCVYYLLLLFIQPRNIAVYLAERHSKERVEREKRLKELEKRRQETGLEFERITREALDEIKGLSPVERLIAASQVQEAEAKAKPAIRAKGLGRGAVVG